jgi:hypothetical protein
LRSALLRIERLVDAIDLLLQQHVAAPALDRAMRSSLADLNSSNVLRSSS